MLRGPNLPWSLEAGARGSRRAALHGQERHLRRPGQPLALLVERPKPPLRVWISCGNPLHPPCLSDRDLDNLQRRRLLVPTVANSFKNQAEIRLSPRRQRGRTQRLGIHIRLPRANDRHRRAQHLRLPAIRAQTTPRPSPPSPSGSHDSRSAHPHTSTAHPTNSPTGSAADSSAPDSPHTPPRPSPLIYVVPRQTTPPR